MRKIAGMAKRVGAPTPTCGVCRYYVNVSVDLVTPREKLKLELEYGAD